jgi:hypothetical protein
VHEDSAGVQTLKSFKDSRRTSSEGIAGPKEVTQRLSPRGKEARSSGAIHMRRTRGRDLDDLANSGARRTKALVLGIHSREV